MNFVKSQSIQKAFKEIDRKDFVSQEMKGFAPADTALPIGWDQTISQPFTVAFMLEKLDPKPSDSILDIGSGSGWTTALLAHIVGKNGKVVALEVIPALKELGEKNIAKYNFKNVMFVCQDGAKGFEKAAPYDKILVSASLLKKEIPPAWKKQLKVGGNIVVPIHESIWVFTKKNKNTFKESEYPGFVFVPFVGS